MLALTAEDIKKRSPLKVGDPLFEYVTGALRFALNFTHGTAKESAITQLMGGGRASKGLGGLDGAAQAGMLRQELERLSLAKRSILVVRYAPSSLPCPCERTCCRGWRHNPEWLEAVKALTGIVLVEGLTGTISHYRFRRAMVEKHFGVRVSFTEMAKVCGISRNTASAQQKKVSEWLKKEEQHARWEFEGLMKEGGVIP